MTQDDSQRTPAAASPGGGQPGPARYMVLAVAVAVAFFAAYAFVTSRAHSSVQIRPAAATQASTVRSGGVQEVSVDVSKGYFDPALIRAQAGVPVRITFGQGSGCMAGVRFAQFGIERDLTAGAAVVELPALESGEYPFSCGMEMVFGKVVVE